MSIEKMIRTMYENTIDIVLHGIDSQYIEEVKTNYLRHLNSVYGNDPISSEEFQNRLIETEKKDWERKSPALKLSILVADENFKHIGIISQMAESLAVKKIIRGESIKMDQDLIHESEDILKELLLQVKPFNEQEASELVSESIYDLECLINDDSFYSSRIREMLKMSINK